MRRLFLAVFLLCVLSGSLLSAAASAQEVTPRVIGGADANPGDFPWTVALVREGLFADAGHFCGGSLVAPTIVVTAVHCIVNPDFDPDEIEVMAGEVDLTANIPEEKFHAVESISLHPLSDVDGDDTRFDVAVLRLAAPISDPDVQPISLLEPGDFNTIFDAAGPAAQQLKVMGWGDTDPTEDEDFLPVLQQVDLDHVEDEDCETVWEDAFFESDMVCALRVSPFADSCNGDSGGPLVTKEPSVAGSPDPQDAAEWRLVGAVSFGSSLCNDDDVPGIYARLGAPALQDSFVDLFTDVNPTNDPPPKPWFQLPGTRRPTLTPRTELDPGDKVTCALGTADVEPDANPVRLVLRRGGTQLATSDTAAFEYTIANGDAGGKLVCEARALPPAGGSKYGDDVRSLESDVVRTPPNAPAPSPPAETPAPPAPPPPDPGPVPTPRDLLAPTVDGFSRRCSRRTRRCTLRVHVDDPAPSFGIRTLRVKITTTTRRRCIKRGRRATCVRRRTKTLRARRGASTESFVVSTGALSRGRHSVSIVPVDTAGNERRTPFRRSFSL